MKVAAVSIMCQDPRVFDAMMNAGTPCPFDGLIGDDAKAAWAANEDQKPDAVKNEVMQPETKKLLGIGSVLSTLGLLLLL